MVDKQYTIKIKVKKCQECKNIRMYLRDRNRITEAVFYCNKSNKFITNPETSNEMWSASNPDAFDIEIPIWCELADYVE